MTNKIFKENIIIAGGNGFLGRQFSKFLAKKNYNIHVIDLKTENLEELTKLTEEIKKEYPNSQTILTDNNDLSM